MKRIEKLALLHRVLSGQASKNELMQLRKKRGRLYTAKERAEQKAYMATWDGEEHTDAEVENFFGRYDKANVPGTTAYLLPNGMYLFFQ